MPSRFALRSWLSFISLFCTITTGAGAEPLPPDHAVKLEASRKLFVTSVRGILEKNCLDCHGGEKTKAGFSLATREALLAGGDRGRVVVPFSSAKSDLVKLVLRQEEPYMPPKKALTPAEQQAIRDWIDLGAAYDKPLVESAEAAPKTLVVTAKDKDYWAYRTLQPVAVPQILAAGSPIDQFIAAQWHARHLQPAPTADKRTWLRRVTFDLIGLPPTPDELAEFLNDTSPLAYETVVDRLLASPHYGERWARHWLDPARFAESHGFEHDYYRPHAYHYRDFVIKALNADMPYDQFVQWQIAGDELAPNDPLALAATGFLGAGVYPTQITNREAERIRYDAMDDMLATTGNAILGMTIGCARCHDHKYDPIPTSDYYRMLAAFTTTVRSEIEVDLGTESEKAAMQAFQKALEPLVAARKTYEQQQLPDRLQAWIAEQKQANQPPPKGLSGPAAKGLESLWMSQSTWAKLPQPQREALTSWFGPQDAGWRERQAAVDEWMKSKPKETKVKIQATTEGRPPMRHHTADGSIPDFYPETYFLKRGDVDQKQEIVQPGLLTVLVRHEHGERHWLRDKPPQATTSHRRANLARWLVDTQHGAGSLAARVMVNRVWHHHFGRGIVSTINDFGFQSEPATHPELLEWLAGDFVQHGWRLKRLHKQIVLSQVYRLSSTPTESALQHDPENHYLSHFRKRRLEAEAIRDNALAVSGLLDRTMYGEGTLDEGMRRRSIYFRVKRAELIPMLQVFDWPDTQTSCGARPVTTVAPQALVFLNSPHAKTWAAGLAARVSKWESPDQQVEQAYRIAFSREPTDRERELGRRFIASRGLPAYTQALLALNEFIYID